MSAKQSAQWAAVLLMGAVSACAASSSDEGDGSRVSSGATDATCSPAWSSTQVYTQGNTASENGVNYVANWWTQGDDPATHNGGAGSGQPWTSQGSCSGSGGGGGTDGGTDSGGGGGNPPPPPGSLIFSPYKDITINMNWNTNTMQTDASGSVIPVVGSNGLFPGKVPNLGAITLAFATGECGSEGWGGVPRASFASANIPALDQAGLSYIVSTGGAAGSFTCSSQSGMTNFINTYMSGHMVGVDYDIESGQSTDAINNLVAQTKFAEGQFPNLRFSFTLATLAASDGSHGGLNSTGDAVVKAIKAQGLAKYTINLMVMDYGSSGTSSVCVAQNGVCNMGQSAIQAVQNLEFTYGIPAANIELTPMIGQNDATSEVVSLSDVDTITSYVRQQGLMGLHFWSLDRDTPCPGGSTSATCSSTSNASLAYTNRFLSDLGR